MSDTPRTDMLLVVHDLDPKPMTLIEHARQLERELAAAQERIKRLAEAGDEVSKKVQCCSGSVSNWNWTKAKEGL